MVWGLALLGAALILNTVAGSIYTRRQIQEAAAELQSEVATRSARHIHSLITRKLERLQDTGVAMTLYRLGGEEQRLLALLLLKNDPAFSGLAVLNDQGMELLKFSERRVYLPADLQNQDGSVSFRKAIRGSPYIGPVGTSDRAEPFMTLATPLRMTPQKIIGVLVAQVNLKFLWEAIGETKFGDAGYAYLINEAGTVIAHKDPSLVLKGLTLRNLPKVLRFLRSRSADSAPAEEGPGITGKPVLSSYAPVPDVGWAVVVEEPLDVALSHLVELQRYAFLLVGIGLLMGATIIFWVSRRITEPIQELREGVESIRHGNLDHRASIKTGDEIEELAEEFNKMTEALQNSYATLEQKVEQRTKERSALYEVATAVNQSLELQTILQAVIKKSTELFRFEATRIFLFNVEMDQLELRASFEVNPEHWTGVRRFKRGQSVIGRVAESGEPMIFEDIQTDPRYLALSASKAAYSAGLRFFAVFPIKTQSRIFGTLLFNGSAARKLTDDEVTLLTSMAEHLGVAVEKASLFEQAQTRSRHLSALNTIGEAVSQSLDLEVVLRQATEKITETLGFDASWIYLVAPSGEELHLKAYKGLSEEAASSMAKRSSTTGISGAVVTKGQRLVFEDLRNNEQYRALSSNSLANSLGFTASAGFPIKAKDKILGALQVVSFAARHFPAEELQLLESVAQEIGVAAENARLFTTVHEKTAELAKMNQELQEATRAKSEFIAAMSHELRTPLNVIIGSAELFEDGLFGDLSPEQKTYVRKISRNARVLLKMINDVLALSRMEAKKMSLDVETVAVEEIIEHARTHVDQMNRDNRLEVRWAVDRDVPSLVTDPLKLEEILQNLIGNAFKFTPRGLVEVRVRNLGDQDRIEFSVADTGIGIEADNLGKIFNEFEQIKEAHTGDYNGVGLGLSIVKKYLELMQGDIQVVSTPGQGSTFIFSIPRSVPLGA